MSLVYDLSYYPWITQGVDPAKIRAAVQVFADAVRSELAPSAGAGVAVNVEMAADVPPQITAVTTRQRHVALMNPLGYVFARRRNPAVQVVAVALRPDADGKPVSTYRAQLYASKKSAVRGVEDVKGRAVGFGVAFSTSNFLFPAVMLKRKHRLFSFGRAEFLGGHDLVARAVYDGKVDVGAGHDGVLTNLARTYGYGDAEERLVRLAWSDPIPSDPVVVNVADDKERDAVQRAVVAAGRRPEVIANAISVFWGGSLGLDATKPGAYDSVDAVLRELALDQDDLLIG